MKYKTHLIFLAVIMLAVSCHKRNHDLFDVTLVQRNIQGKWTFDSLITNDHVNGLDNIVSITGSSGDYMEFAGSGNLSLRLLSFVDTSTYSVLQNNRLVLDRIDTFEIKVLTSTQLQFQIKKGFSSSYYIQTYNLHR